MGIFSVRLLTGTPQTTTGLGGERDACGGQGKAAPLATGRALPAGGRGFNVVMSGRPAAFGKGEQGEPPFEKGFNVVMSGRPAG